MNRSSGTLLAVIVCVAAQVFCACLPTGAPVCVRSLMGWFPARATLAPQADCCSSDCFSEDCVEEAAAEDCCEALLSSEQEFEGPCREPACCLHIGLTAKVPPQRAVSGIDDLPYASLCVPYPLDARWLTLTLAQSVHREPPPNDSPPPRSRGLVGTVILVV